MPQTDRVIPILTLEKQLKISYNILYKKALCYELPFVEVHALLKAQDYKCALTGVPFDLQNPLIISRIHASKSYQINNVMLCLQQVHNMRRELSITEFRKLCRWVIHTYDRKGYLQLDQQASQVQHA